MVLLSLMALSPWPRWTIQVSPLPLTGEESGARAVSVLPHAGLIPLGDLRILRGSDVLPPAVTDGPSLAAVLWQAFLDELVKPQAAAAQGTWRWPATVAAVLLVGVAGGLGWLVLGLAAVQRQRLRSRRLANHDLLELVDVLRAELGCRRPVEIRQSNDLVTAATIGWRRPAVLLPSDWPNWTSQQRRAVLAHEIAHARSHDFLALLFGQLGVMLHFYHPLVHWLMSRLRLEQELAADAAAASVSGGQREYLTTIAETRVAEPGPADVLAGPHFSADRDHFSQENCHVEELEASS